jgi:hypothetical protein
LQVGPDPADQGSRAFGTLDPLPCRLGKPQTSTDPWRTGRVLKKCPRTGCLTAKQETLPPARALRILARAIAPAGSGAGLSWCGQHRSLRKRRARAGGNAVRFGVPPKGAIPFPGPGRFS